MMNGHHLWIAVWTLTSALIMNVSAGQPAPGTPPADSGFRAPAAAPRSKYTIDCTLDLEAGRFEATQQVRFKNDATAPLSRLAMAWPLLKHGGELDITIDGKTITPLPSAVAPDGSPLIAFDLPHPLSPGELLTIDCRFSLQEDSGGQPARILLTHWHPRLWWGYPAVDDFAVRITAPEGYTLGSSGRLNRDTGRYEIDSAREFGLFLGRGFQVIEAESGDVAVRCLHEPDAEECARLLVDTAVDVIGFYRERFGLYPCRTLTIIPGSDRPMGGYPAATALVAIHGMQRMPEKPRLHWQWITAHEIGHQYFGEHVLEHDPHGWLWIGLGIHADREYIRARGLGLDHHRQIVDRYTAGAAEGLDTTLHRTAEEIVSVGFDYNNIAQHGKGFSVISALACVLGSETFDRICFRCLHDFAGRRLSVEAFEAICEAESGRDLGWFFDAWVRSNRYLRYEITSESCTKRDDSYLTRIRVESRGTLRMPVPVLVSFEDGTSQERFTDRLLPVNDLEFFSAAPLKEARLDPRDELAMVKAAASAPAPALAKTIQALPWTGAGRQALDAFEAAKAADLSDARLWLKLGLLLYDGKYYPDALDAFRRQAERSKPGETTYFSALVWQGHMLDLLDRREEAMSSYQKALQASDGHEIRHDQYGLRVNRAWVEKRLKEPFRRDP